MMGSMFLRSIVCHQLYSAYGELCLDSIIKKAEIIFGKCEVHDFNAQRSNL